MKRIGYFLKYPSESPSVLAEGEGQPPVIILGMHRSGTTLTSKLLRQAGVNMGWLRGSDTDESIFFQSINKAIFSVAHCDWDTPEVLNEAMSNELFLEATTKAIRELSARKSQNRAYFGSTDLRNDAFSTMSAPWGWKDPRTCLTFPIWTKLYPKAKIIFVQRNGIDVANSLLTRNKKLYGKPPFSVRLSSLNDAFKLWEDYNRSCLHQLNKLNRGQYISLRYEDLLENPKLHLSRIFDFIGNEGQFKVNDKSVEGINGQRAFAFTNTPELKVFYQRVKNTDLMKEFGYSDIL